MLLCLCFALASRRATLCSAKAAEAAVIVVVLTLSRTVISVVAGRALVILEWPRLDCVP